MKKSFLFAVLIISAVMSCGCAAKNGISQEKAADYISQLYNRKFTLVNSVGEQGNLCYTFADEEGIQCHFVLETYHIPTDDELMPDTYYTITEDYQVMYMKAHPETYQNISAEMIPTWNEGENMINSVRFTLNYKSCEDIEPLVNDVYEKISSVPKLTPADNISDSMGVCSECAVIDFYCPYLSENPDVQMYFPMINKYTGITPAEDIISQLQAQFSKEGVSYDDSWQKSNDFSTIPESYTPTEISPYDPDEHRQEQQEYDYYDESYEYADYGYGYDDYDYYGYY
ncbi:MAG: hypothetical protein IJM19_04040 [Ruminococcus sp.]|nr:hypothetical protein [Ruminococcus sp.]